MRYEVSGKTITVTAKDSIGKGGEADVYDLHDGTALKIFKGPKDADYANDPVAQEGARRRLEEQQRKLPAFPKGLLLANVVAPRDLATNGTGKIAGYTMEFLQGYEVLLRYGDRRFREQSGVDPNRVIEIFYHLALNVEELHKKHVVIGDFNDLNVLVPKLGDPRLIDADSFQFANFTCWTFTPRFLDPKHSSRTKLALSSPLDQLSDWYAYAVMLFQTLLYVGPYGGVHRPAAPPKLQHDQRVLQRITVFDPDVIYPKPAIPYGVLPDDLLDYFVGVFKKDERVPFDTDLLDMRWTTCANCGTVHARSVCPGCAIYVKKEPVVVRGAAKAQRVFWTEGTIVAAAVQHGKLLYVYHNGQEFVREDGSLVDKGALDPGFRYRIWGNKTIIGRRNKALFLPDRLSNDVDAYGHLPVFDANSEHVYWVGQDGILYESGTVMNKPLGGVVPGRTLFWVGERFGFGFYRAGDLMRAFVFNEYGLHDDVAIPGFKGELVDASCVFSEDRAWFFATLQETGVLRNHVYVVSRAGTLLRHHVVDQTEDSWLASGIRGRFAAGTSLFVPTDEGIVKIDESDLVYPAKSFPDAEPFVDSTSYLLGGNGGIYVVKSNEITLVTM